MRKRMGAFSAIVSILAWSLLWSSPAWSESVFNAGEPGYGTKEGALQLRLALPANEMDGAAALYTASGQDSMETFDIELEENEKPGIYKEIAMVAIVAAAVGYMVYTMIAPGDETEEPADTSSGKPIPFVRVSFGLIR